MVTGGTGFVGSHTVELLLQHGHEVRCLVRFSTPSLGWLKDLPIEVFRGSYFSVDTLTPALQGVDYVLHIAGVTKAKKHKEYHNGNVLATKNLLEAASAFPGIRKFTFVSSLTAAGPSLDGQPLLEDQPGIPITTYGVTKLEAETLCQMYSNRIPLTVLRPPAVYGPRDSDLLQVFRWLKHGIAPIFGSSRKRLSLIYGPELARAILAATFSDRTSGETYYVSDKRVYSLVETLELASAILGRRAHRVTFPGWLLYSIAAAAEFTSFFGTSAAVLNVEKARDLLQTYWICDPSKLAEHTGFETTVSLEEGLRTTLEWYRNSGWL